jgi:hypothetical protein
MPLGILSDDDYEKEMNKLNGLRAPSVEIKEPTKLGRRSNEIPESIRKIVGETALEAGRAEAQTLLQQTLGVSAMSSIDAWKEGKTSSCNNETRRDLVNHMLMVREKITNKAQKKLIQAIDSITKDKLEGSTAKDASSVAKDMSAVIKNMDNEVKESNQPTVNFVLVAPKSKTEEQYDVIIDQSESR